jgi:hypothetical protein
MFVSGRPLQAVYNQWTTLPADFDPVGEGLIYVETPAGDFDMDDALDVDDIDVLAERIRLGYVDSNGYWNDAMFDVNGDSQVDFQDHRVWVNELAYAWYGDADLNGEFKSDDFVLVFQAGKYRTGEYAGWAEGDWNGDGIFDSSDFAIAFIESCYEGMDCGYLSPSLVAVPEPGTWLLCLMGMTLLWRRRTERGVCPEWHGL